MEFGCYGIDAGDHKKFDDIFAIATAYLTDKNLIEAMAVSIKEMLSNIREHSYHLDDTRPIDFQIRITWMEVVVTICDRGEPWITDGYFYFIAAEKHLLDLMHQEAERGRGQAIMYLLADSLEYHAGGRLRRMTWRINRGNYAERKR